jgi:hypothetical protein
MSSTYRPGYKWGEYPLLAQRGSLVYRLDSIMTF